MARRRASTSIAARTDFASIIVPLSLFVLELDVVVVVDGAVVVVEEEEGKVAKAERAALKAGVSVRRWRARFTLSERTLVDLIWGDDDAMVLLIMVVLM